MSLIPAPKRTDIGEELKKHAPQIAFFSGNGLLLVGEVRVWDYAISMTGDVWKACLAVLATFIPFVIWEIAVQHDKANALMRICAWTGMVISLALGVAIGIADFVMIDGSSPDSGMLLGALAASLSIHAVLLLVYFYAHPEITARRLTAEALARESLALQNAQTAQRILSAARRRLTQERNIAQEFGRDELAKTLSSLTGQEYVEADQDLDSPPPQLFAAQNLAHAPTPVSAGTSGNNGHRSNVPLP